jgi:hypothetical protein
MSIEINMNKTRVKKRFKRYGQHRAGTGYDTAHRDLDVSEEEFARNWERTFGRKDSGSDQSPTKGLSKEVVSEE